MADRLCNEIENYIQQLDSIDVLSFVAHSLGGLIVRYAIFFYFLLFFWHLFLVL